MAQALRIKQDGTVNPEQRPLDICVDYQKAGDGHDTIVKGIPETDVLEFIVSNGIEPIFIGHRPVEDTYCQRLRMHFKNGHRFIELLVKTAVKCDDGELTVHYQGQGEGNLIGQLYLPTLESKEKATHTIGGTKIYLLPRLV